jgi:hypothetical protein
LAAAVIVREASALPNRQYRWVVTLEPLINIKANSPRLAIDLLKR